MKTNPWITAALAALLAFLTALGGTGCLVTAFELDVNLTAVGYVCLAAAVGSSLCFRLRRGDLLLFGILAVMLGFWWRSGDMEAHVGAMLYEISRRYDNGYGWGYVDMPPGDMDSAFGCICILVAVWVSMTVSHRRGSLDTVTVALLPLFACLVVTDTVPGVGYLFCLLLGVLVLILTGYIRQNTPEQADSLMLMVLLPAAAALGLAFWLMPEDEYVNQAEDFQDEILEWVTQTPQKLEELLAGDGTQDLDIPKEVLQTLRADQQKKYDLGAQGPRSDLQADIEVMDIRAETPGVIYLRGQDYSTYTGTTWTVGSGREEDFLIGWGLDGVDAGRVTVTTRWKWDVRYVPYYPADGITLDGGRLDNDGALTYSFTRRVLPVNWRMAVSDGRTGEVDEGYLQLPKDTLDWARELADELVSPGDTATDKANAIAAYVRGSAVYDLETPQMPRGEEDFAQWFLEDSNTGYCVHFATAAAVLLRAADVECRYVTGYMVYVSEDRNVTVSADRAHAWVEYYEPSLDTWLVLEATPSALNDPAGEDIDDPATEPEESDTSEATASTRDTEPSETADEPGQDSQDRPGSDRDDGPGTDKPDPDRDTSDRSGSWLWLLWLLIPALLAGAVGQRYIRLGIRRKLQQEADPNALALLLLAEAEHFARVLKVPVPKELTDLAQKAKYSPHILTGEELALFRQYLRQAETACRGQSRAQRFLHRWIHALY